MALKRSFYARDPALVAKGLLGDIVVRKIGSDILSGKIVETEAYYGREDPASRAYRGRKNYNDVMFGEPGRAFIYMVHSWWLLNIVAHRKGGIGAVLIRALEPNEGIELMKRNRGQNDVLNLTSGPGKLTRALIVTKELNGIDITGVSSRLTVIKGKQKDFEIGSSHRIGVTEDLPQELRFFIKKNGFLSMNI